MAVSLGDADTESATTVQVGVEVRMGVENLISAEGKAGDDDMIIDQEGGMEDIVRSPAQFSNTVDAAAMPPSVAEIAAAINEKQEAALQLWEFLQGRQVFLL